MIRWKLKAVKFVVIALDAATGNDRAQLEFTGDDRTIAIAKSILFRQYGAFGHQITEFTTAIDLDKAMKTKAMSMFNPRCIEGAEIGSSYQSGVPKSAKT